MDRIPEWGRSQIAILVEFGIEYGLTASRCLSETNVREERLFEFDATKAREIQVIKNILTALDMHPFQVGIEVGRRCDVRTFGVLGQAILSSKTLLEAANLTQKYLAGDLHFNRIRLNKRQDGIYTLYERVDKYANSIEQFLIARDMGATIAFHEHLLRSVPELLLEIGFVFDWLPGMETLEEHFDCEVKVRQKENYTKGNNLLTYLKLPFSNSILFNKFDQQLESLLNVSSSRKFGIPLKQQVITQMEKTNYQSISREDMAKLLNVSSRTLARYLQSEGTSWRCLVSNIRLNKAKVLLVQSDKSVDNISNAVGFSSASAFSAAFSRECGTSPIEFRDQYRD